MQILSMNTVICCHRTQFLQFDTNANADVKCEQGVTPSAAWHESEYNKQISLYQNQ